MKSALINLVNTISNKDLATHMIQELGKMVEGVSDDEVRDKGRLAGEVASLVVSASVGSDLGVDMKEAVYILQRIVNMKPITALTGEADEWGEVGENGWRKNLRFTGIRKQESTGRSYNFLKFKEVSFPYIVP